MEQDVLVGMFMGRTYKHAPTEDDSTTRSSGVACSRENEKQFGMEQEKEKH